MEKDDIIKEWMEESRLSIPSPDFTSRVMDKIETVAASKSYQLFSGEELAVFAILIIFIFIRIVPWTFLDIWNINSIITTSVKSLIAFLPLFAAMAGWLALKAVEKALVKRRIVN